MAQTNVNKADHQKLAAWFLGPKGENEEQFLQLITQALQSHTEWRRSYYPTDPLYVTSEIKNSKQYKDQMAIIREELNNLNLRMRNSLPTFSSRYKGHMNWEVSMLGLVGYFTAMLYNQNNVATEASAVTTMIEAQVGDDLCKMLQFRSHHEGFDHSKYPTAWGHLTSCGSVANFEGAWAARNIKYLTYTIREALNVEANAGGRDLKVVQANGQATTLYSLDPKNPDHLWTMLNIPANNSLQLLHDFADKLGGKEVALKAIRQYGPQAKGMGAMPGNPPAYIVPATAHYSWPKSGALLGMGEDHMHSIKVDQYGRLDVEALKAKLNELEASKTPVLLVVAILGSTTEGAMDPISKVAALRESLRASKNLDFNLHADAAWGGYCCSMLDPPTPGGSGSSSTRSADATTIGYVPITELSSHVREQLQSIHLADSITLDPHKAGYIQYPAGSICFQNKRMRDMLAYKAPYISPAMGSFEDPSVGTYGIDGSRPGAAAVATYLHHRIAGLTPNGHGALVGQANFTAKKFWALLATMADASDPFVISQIHQPKAEWAQDLKLATTLPNEELVYNPTLTRLLQENGPDFLINTFAVNFATPILTLDGQKREWNNSLEMARQLMNNVDAQLNTPYTQIDPDTTRPRGVSRKGLFVIRNTLFTETYLQAITELTKHIHLPYDPKKDREFSMLVSTNMEPWSTAKGFLETFNKELRQAILKGIGMILDKDTTHSFVLVDAHGAEVFGDYVSSFHSPEHQYQTVVKIEFGAGEANALYGNEGIKYEVYSKYRAATSGSSTPEPLVLSNKIADTLDGLLYRDDGEFWFEADVHVGVNPNTRKSLGSYWVRVSDVIMHHHFDPAAKYPTNERYLVFGSREKVYATHIITQYPNYHHLLDVQNTIPGLSDMLSELGVEVTVAGVSTEADRTNSPLKNGFTYPLEFVRENNEPFASSLTVQKNVWFSANLNAKASAVQTPTTAAVQSRAGRGRDPSKVNTGPVPIFGNVAQKVKTRIPF